MSDKMKLSVEIAFTKGGKNSHITVSDGDSKFRVYSGKNTIARTVGGVIGHFVKKHEKKKIVGKFL